MTFPLDLRFKWLALAAQIAVTDAAGTLVFYVRQRAFTLREAVTVFADAAQTRPLYRIAADRMIDFSARYRIEDAAGAPVGSVRRHGMRSLWRAHYDVERPGTPPLAIREENPWVKVVDGIAGQIPVLGFFTGYLFHPAYRVTPADSGRPVLRVVKRPAFLESRYTIERLDEVPAEVAPLAVLAVLMMLLLERGRG